MIVLWKERMWIAGLLCGLSFLYFFLPSVGLAVFASPDETSYALVAEQIASHRRAFLPEPLVSAFPWMHPRSWVSATDKLVPVGFLGWPFFLAFFYYFVGLPGLSIIGSALILSSVWPFFCLLRKRFSFFAAWWGTAITFTVPPMILYANRSLFPNVIQIALLFWGLWGLENMKRETRKGMFFILAFLWTLIIAIRPVEFFWIAPWFLWFVKDLRPTKRQWYEIALGILTVGIPLLLLAQGAYGSFAGVGYGLRDSVPSIEYGVSSMQDSKNLNTQYRLPYGFHPRTLLWNLGAYIGWMLLPWAILIVVSVWTRWDRRPLRLSHIKKEPVLLLSLWTLGVLLFLYGSGLYLDRIGPRAASIGNSFLRYMLPLAPLIGVAAAFLHERVRLVYPSRVRLFSFALILLSLFGMYRAFIADDEGLMYTRRELQRYDLIRQATRQWFKPTDVIVSDRSDKVFFPAFRAVSPMPKPEEVLALTRAGVGVGLFARPMMQSQKDAWRNVGLDPQELASFQREKLYRLVPVR